MFAVIRVHFEKEFLTERLFAGIKPGGTLAVAIQRSQFRDSKETMPDISHWDLSPSRTVLCFREGTQALQFHVENHLSSSDVILLKENVAEWAATVIDAAKNQSLAIREIVVTLFVENGHRLSVARKETMFSFLIKQFLDRLSFNLTVALANVILGALIAEVKGAGIAFGATLIGVIAQLILEAARFKGEFVYEDAT